MNPIATNQLAEALNWRYATKTFDATKTIPAATWAALEDALIKTPSSYGMQPYRFLVLTDKALREKLVPLSWGQRQVVDSSHFVVFLARAEVKAEHVDEFIQRIATVRGTTADALKGYRDMIVGDVVNGPRKAVAPEWAARQAYIALGQLMTAAALLGVDACPMEGFSPADYDEALGLKGTGYRSVVACALGYRAASDKYATIPKVRFATETLIERR
jgi:nitroreductase